MSLQWNAPLQPDYVITAYTLHHRVPSLKSQSEMWAPPLTATVQFHTYNPRGILFYQINSVMADFLGATVAYSGANLQATVTGLSPATLYFFSLVAYNAGGSTQSNASSVTTIESSPDGVPFPNVTIIITCA
eukprot:Em0016g1139a